MPLPEPDAASTPLAFASSVDHGLLEALVDGREDGPRAVLLAARAVDVLAEEGFDKLVALEKVRGVERLGYQIETAMRVMRRFRGRVLLSDEVGLGKTVEAGLVMLEYMERGLAGRCLVLVPPALVGQWREELASKFGIEATTTRDPAFRRDPAGFWSRPGTIVASLATARSELHAERIAAERFDLLVVDEAHHVKNRSTAGWKLVNSIRSRFFLMLTATPVETDLSELYNLVTVLRPGTLGTEADFRARFVDPDDPSRPRDADGLRRLLSDVMIRNTRATCGVMLPPRTARTVLVAPTAAEAALYGRLVDMSRRARGRSRNLVRLLMEEAGSTPAALARTAERSLRAGADPDLASDLEAVSREAAALETTAKLEALARILPGDPVLVFSRFRNSLERIAAHLTARSVRLGLYHGGLDAAEKDRAVDDLRAGRTDVLLCSGIGGEGRNLQFCRRLVNFDLPWNPMTIEQRIGRIHRIGQTGHVEVVNLATAGTAEERILDVLDARVNMFELVVGEMDMVLGETVDERDFGDRVYDIYATSENEDGVERGFDALADELLEARRKLERTHALDEELFGEEYGT
jgi:SNF2 family DNA or RNA helicase